MWNDVHKAQGMYSFTFSSLPHESMSESRWVADILGITLNLFLKGKLFPSGIDF